MSVLPDPSDRREHVRVAMQLQVRCRQLQSLELAQVAGSLGKSDPPIPALSLGNSGISRMSSVNVSKGGLSAEGDLQLDGEQSFAKGTDLVVEFDLPDGKGPVRAVAQVMWAVGGGEGKKMAGLMFLLISDHNTQRLQALIAEQAKA